jgi:hypothetical protein
METNSTLVRGSRYTGGGVTEVNSQTLEWWERNLYVSDPSDTAYVVEKRFEGRLDLITAIFLGSQNVRYWWVVAMLNNILDPFAEVVEGQIIYIPSTERLALLTTGQLGGIASTREVPTSITPIV